MVTLDGPQGELLDWISESTLVMLSGPDESDTMIGADGEHRKVAMVETRGLEQEGLIEKIPQFSWEITNAGRLVVEAMHEAEAERSSLARRADGATTPLEPGEDETNGRRVPRKDSP